MEFTNLTLEELKRREESIAFRIEQRLVWDEAGLELKKEQLVTIRAAIKERETMFAASTTLEQLRELETGLTAAYTSLPWSEEPFETAEDVYAASKLRDRASKLLFEIRTVRAAIKERGKITFAPVMTLEQLQAREQELNILIVDLIKREEYGPISDTVRAELATIRTAIAEKEKTHDDSVPTNNS